jgi:hypothetical protein
MRQTYSLALVFYTSTIHNRTFKRVHNRLVNRSTLHLLLEKAPNSGRRTHKVFNCACTGAQNDWGGVIGILSCIM